MLTGSVTEKNHKKVILPTTRSPPSWILTFEIFNGRNAQLDRTASPCQMWSKSVKPRPRYGDFSIFPRWRPTAILDLLCVSLNHPLWAFNGLYRSLSLCKIWLKSMPLPVRKSPMGFLWKPNEVSMKCHGISVKYHRISYTP